MTIIRPYITERSSELSAHNVYCFEVARSATKGEIAKAAEVLYKTKPISVRTVNLPAKKVRRGAKEGSRAGVRKAYVKFPEGTKIEFV